MGPEIRSAAGRKDPVHFGAASRPLFGFYHPPSDAVSRGVGVVLCSPIGTDHTRSDRTYRHLAERLAAAGFACLRFDLFGTGDSGGDEFEPNLALGWLADVAAAAESLQNWSRVHTIALVGLRLGASVAMTYAAEHGNVDSLVLWNPCISGTSFVNEVTKLHKLYTRIEPHLALAPAPHSDGEEALGCFLPRALVDELAHIDLLRVSRRPARRTLVIDGGNVAGRDALMARLQELGACPVLRHHPGHKFLVTVSHRASVPEEVLGSIVSWLVEAYPLTSPSEPAARSMSRAGPCGEQPVIFGNQHPLFGILTPADPTASRPGRPRILLSNAGCVNRAGPHRTYVKMARRWAKLGFDVLRVDLAGIGDSPAAPREEENLNYPSSGLDDLDQAMTALGPGPIIVAGLCSGGDYAFQLGARDDRVVGAWLLNPRTFGVLALASVESGSPPTTPVEAVPRTLHAMAERGIDTLLVVSRNDPGVAYVDDHAALAMGSLSALRRFHRADIDGADHSFTPVALQDRVSDVLTEHLARLYARSPSDGPT